MKMLDIAKRERRTSKAYFLTKFHLIHLNLCVLSRGLFNFQDKMILLQWTSFPVLLLLPIL